MCKLCYGRGRGRGCIIAYIVARVRWGTRERVPREVTPKGCLYDFLWLNHGFWFL